jgi:hypothetical protein
MITFTVVYCLSTRLCNYLGKGDIEHSISKFLFASMEPVVMATNCRSYQYRVNVRRQMKPENRFCACAASNETGKPFL